MLFFNLMDFLCIVVSTQQEDLILHLHLQLKKIIISALLSP